MTESERRPSASERMVMKKGWPVRELVDIREHWFVAQLLCVVSYQRGDEEGRRG